MNKTQKSTEGGSRDGSRSPDGDFSGSDSSYRPDHKDRSDSEDGDHGNQSRRRRIKTLKPMMKVEDALKQFCKAKDTSMCGKVRVYEKRSKQGSHSTAAAKKANTDDNTIPKNIPKKMKSATKPSLIVRKEEFDKLRHDVEGAKALIRALNETLSTIMATKPVQTPKQGIFEKTREPEPHKTSGHPGRSAASLTDYEWNSPSHKECSTSRYQTTLNGVARMAHKHKGLDSLIASLKRRLESSAHYSGFERSSTPNPQEVHQSCQEEPLLYEMTPARHTQHSATVKREPSLIANHPLSMEQMSTSTAKILNAIENMETPKIHHDLDTSCVSRKDAILEDFRSDDEMSSTKTPFKKRKLPIPETTSRRDDSVKKSRHINTSIENISPEGNSNEMVPIGIGRTLVPRRVYEQIDWKCYTIATRKLLMSVFTRSVLATHSLTGKASPAFVHKPPKPLLDLTKVADIVMTVAKRCKVSERLVRSAITTKCADEGKLQRLQAAKESRKKNTTIDN